jgi:hypothetical protein
MAATAEFDAIGVARRSNERPLPGTGADFLGTNRRAVPKIIVLLLCDDAVREHDEPQAS